MALILDLIVCTEERDAQAVRSCHSLCTGLHWIKHIPPVTSHLADLALLFLRLCRTIFPVNLSPHPSCFPCWYTALHGSCLFPGPPPPSLETIFSFISLTFRQWHLLNAVLTNCHNSMINPKCFAYFILLQIEAYNNTTWKMSVSPAFPTACAHLLSMCQILIIISIFCTCIFTFVSVLVTCN